MEIRASYLLVGAVVLAILAALAAFSVWLVQADVDRSVARYEIVFTGSVSGLQVSGQVLYRGIPVGRVADIRIDPDNVEQVLVVVEIDEETPIKEDTVATLEMQGVTGLAYVQLQGGTQDGAILASEGDRLPRIASQPSALEQVFQSTPELLAEALGVAGRLSRLLDQQNLDAIAATLSNLQTFSAMLAERSDSIDALLVGAGAAAGRVDGLTAEFALLTTDLRQLSTQLGERVDGVADDAGATLAELRAASTALTGVVENMDGMVDDLREPLSDFAGTGLYEFTQLVGESRVLIAALTRITKEFERDPAGFLIGRTSRGFEAE
jgi:phospholipid/cholesterol/gamma-HCH transport system substrate-binding protein